VPWPDAAQEAAGASLGDGPSKSKSRVWRALLCFIMKGLKICEYVCMYVFIVCTHASECTHMCVYIHTVCVCVYMCVRVYGSIMDGLTICAYDVYRYSEHTCIRAYISMHTYTHYVYVHVCVCVCTRVRARAHVCVCMHAYKTCLLHSNPQQHHLDIRRVVKLAIHGVARVFRVRARSRTRPGRLHSICSARRAVARMVVCIRARLVVFGSVVVLAGKEGFEF